jgi:hypothetical protein
MQWAWLSGLNALNAPGAYGTKGIPSVNNYPGARHEYSMVFDPAINGLYLFGGYGYDLSTHSTSQSTKGYLSVTVGPLYDFWSYDISSLQWTWMYGINGVDYMGTYGTRGIPSIDNYPGGRNQHSIVIDSTLNFLYMFGGYGNGRITYGKLALTSIHSCQCRLFK